MKADYVTGNFIGVGELSAHTIIQKLFEVDERHLREFPTPGIYRQIPLSYLIKWEIFSALRADFQKGSIDILVIDRFHRLIACRVQGKKGSLKLQRESLQKSLLEDALVHVVDIDKRECAELFKERVNDKSIQEIRDSFKTAKVEILN